MTSAEKQARWRALNPERNREQRKKTVAARLSLIREAKARPCADCGGRFPPVCMDFDHLADKVMGVSTMAMRRLSPERIRAEIAKCEVVCANCHRIRTQGRVLDRQAEGW